MTTINSTEFDAIVAEMRRTEAEARATACGVTGCDGEFHGADVDPQRWHHKVESDADELLQYEMVIDGEGRAHADVLATFDDETFVGMDGDAVRALADRLEAEPARLREFAARLDRRSLPEQRVNAVAANVRGSLTYVVDGMHLTAKPLAEILEISTQRARDLHNGRAPFTADEIRLLSAYFDCEADDWTSERGPRVPYPFDRPAAEDRLMTARESGGLHD
ncbi:hypothetical protein SAMN04487783_2109 [Agrococcus baldri]|uniref:Helix-turn-helix domain-containing protein n=2 Tax=Agrococcus baldri TaxID=153730 RepID=A0AA94HNJ2_9MICO|nr:hypothetical protein SAMN04487783_2109 [Agrococcus baldri]